MKLCGHTMGTPERDIFETIRLFSEIGYEGIEIRCAEDGHIDPERITDEQIKEIRKAAHDAGIEIACLTPYYKNYLTPEEREKSIAGMKRTIEVAAALDCKRVRSYGGITPPKNRSASEVWRRTVEGIRIVAEFAERFGVTICIENHAGTLTMSARETADFVADVNHPNVGILYDHAWVRVAGRETASEAVQIMKPYIRHVHVKDWKFVGGDTENRRACLLGEGDIEWREVISALLAIGYDGFLSDEYEKRWMPYLPDAAGGMRHNREYLLSLLKESRNVTSPENDK